MKMILSPALAIHLEKGGIKPNSVIEINECKLCVNEQDANVDLHPNCLIITKLKIVSNKINNPIIVRKKNKNIFGYKDVFM